MDLLVCTLKKAKKHEFNFLQAYNKSQENMNLIFARLKKLKKYKLNFLQA